MGDPQQSETASAELARRAVRILTEFTGRGPAKAHTIFNRDTVMILLADTLTKGEQSLAERGLGDHVLDTRRRYQEAMKPDLIAAVEEVTGRSVIAFMSGNHIDPDMAAEIFVLEPQQDAPITPS